MTFVATAATAQRTWNADLCIQYAVEHNRSVRSSQLNLADYEAEHLRAKGAFLPSVNGSVGGQVNFGRAIDPETNTYTTVSTLYNSYGVSASIPVFDGLQRCNGLQAARASVLMGRQGVLAQKEQVAQQVLRQYVDAVYQMGTLRQACQKREESRALLVLFMRRYVLPLVVSWLIAVPMAYRLGTLWLEGFAEYTPIHWWIFPLAFVVIGCVVMLTVVIQCWHVATTHPMDSIRTE